MEKNNIAIFIDDLETERIDVTQKLWKVSPPVVYIVYDDGNSTELETEYIVTSAATLLYLNMPETYIFPSNSKGDILNWYELDGSFRGALNHELAIERMGYEVKYNTE